MSLLGSTFIRKVTSFLPRLQRTPDHQKSFSSHAYIAYQKKPFLRLAFLSTVHISFLSVEPGTDSTAFRYDVIISFFSLSPAQP
jgi:hypothetical protein